MCEGFLPKVLHTCPKTPENDLQKNNGISFHVGRISSNQSTSITIFGQISPKLAQISPDWTLIVVAIFVKSKNIQRF